MFRLVLVLPLLLAALPGPAAARGTTAGDVHPLAADRSGIEWLRPFPATLAAAEERRRLLILKPVAFGTTADAFW